MNFLDGDRAFSVRERIAFCDFLVPNARPRALRAALRLCDGLLAAAVDGARGVARTVRVFVGTSCRVDAAGSKMAR